MPSSPRQSELRVFGLRLLRESSAELARLRRIRGASWRTARRIARARARLAFAAALLGAPLAQPALARPPSFTSPLAPFGLSDAGDFAAPDFADIDGDGDLDAFVGEEYGSTLFFANTGTASAPAFAAPVPNPFGLADVGSLGSPDFVDLDDDGDLDALVGEGAGTFRFFANTGTASTPAFAPPATNPFGLSGVGYSPAPDLADIDGDGDLDAFVGERYGDTRFFENTGTAASPAFAPPGLGFEDVGFEALPTLVDVDGDGDLDAFLGDATGQTRFFENTGTASAPAFPAPATNPFGLLDLGRSANPAFADIDADGDLDAFLGQRFGDTFFLENTGAATGPAFAPPAGLTPGLGDAGTRAVPAFADLDGDGDLDVVVGTDYGTMLFFANTGTATAPAFAAPDTDPFGLADVGSRALPAFADLDDDGDLDALVGENDGSLFFFANTGTASSPSFAAPATNPFGLADVGSLGSPAFADLDGDGDLDVLVGDVDGILALFENTGTASTPAFGPTVTNPFGAGSGLSWASPTFADLDGDGDLDAFVGEIYGNTVLFENTGTADAPAFAGPATNSFGLTDAGGEVSPRFADLDGDGDLDAFFGRDDGLVIRFENLAALCPAHPEPSCTEGFAKGSLSVDERKPGKEKLGARLSKGPALAQPGFGDPLVAGGTAAALCLYDGGGARVAALEVDRAGQSCSSKACWKPLGKPPPDGKGFAYRDAAGSEDGVRSIQLTGGGAGRSSLAFAASNQAKKGQTALPTGITAKLAAATQVTLQVQLSDASCFSATLSEVTKQASDLFKAR